LAVCRDGESHFQELGFGVERCPLAIEDVLFNGEIFPNFYLSATVAVDTPTI
jgi:hypothetical protein